MDTNILYRGGQDVLRNFQKLCKAALENLLIQIIWRSKNSVNEYISPGGSADLLALSIFPGL